MKTCTKCNEKKPLSEFYKQKSNKDGLKYHCKICAKFSANEWYYNNSEKAKQTRAQYHINNRDKIKEKSKLWMENNKEKNKATKQKWNKNNLEKIRESSKRYREKNPLKMMEFRSLYAKNNKEKVKESRKSYELRNKEALKEKAKIRRLNNPETHKRAKHNRRARERSAVGSLSAGLVKKLLIVQRGKCACCGLPLGNDYHLDHIMPLALGGTNTDDNIQLLRAKCNLQKNAKHPIDFMQSRGFLL